LGEAVRMDILIQFVPLLVVLLLVGWACWFFLLRPKTDNTALPVQALTGIQGWLILVAIGQVALPLVVIVQLAISLVEYRIIWKIHPIFVAGWVALYGAVLLFTLWCSFNFFKKRREFPQLFIWELWLLVFVPFLGVIWATLVTGVKIDNLLTSDDWKDVVRSLITAIAWTLYTLRSVRVKNTFAN
jgi:hypothetical protein